MGYYVEYFESAQPKGTSGGSLLRISMMTAACFLAFCFLVHNVLPHGQEVIQQILFPGSDASTRQAAEIFVSELQNGEPVADALESFCRKVLNDAALP